MTGELNIFGHDGDAHGVNGALVDNFKEADVSLLGMGTGQGGGNRLVRGGHKGGAGEWHGGWEGSRS